jgi:Flp pilus assembly protein TadG
VTGLFQRWGRSREGQSLVEFALSSVLFFTLVFGIIQFGRAVYQYNTVSNLAQEGARWASVHGGASATPATAAQLQAYVETRAMGLPITVTATPANPSAVSPGSLVTVRVVSSFAPATALLPFTTLSLESTAQMIVSR